MKKRVAPDQRSAALRCFHRRAERFAALGLTTKGLPYRRRKNFTDPVERMESQRRHGRLEWQRAAREHRLAGLTTRGGKPVFHPNLRRQLLQEIDGVAAVAAKVFPTVPAIVQHRLLDLGERLIRLKRKLE